ncbi:MAG: phosphodiester glycosidase family protein [Cyclonatronaceae bacterium]
MKTKLPIRCNHRFTVRFIPRFTTAVILTLVSLMLLHFSKPETAFSADTTRTRVAPGFFFTQIEDPSVPIRISALEINISRPNVTIRNTLSNNRLGSAFSNTRSMAREYHSEDHQVIGALNGDYFGISDASNPYTYVRNLMIKDNEYVIGKNYSRSQFGMTTDGTPFVSMFSFAGQAELPNGVLIPIHAVNQERNPGRAVLYNHYFGFDTRTDENGVEVKLELLDEMQVGKPLRFVAREMEIEEGSMEIPGREFYILSAHGPLGSSLADTLAIGDTLLVNMGFNEKITGSILADTLGYTFNGRNIGRSTDFMVLYDRWRGNSTGTNEFGKEILLQPIGELTYNGLSELVVIKEEDGIGDMEIPLGHVVASGHGDARDFLRENISVGDTVRLDLQSDSIEGQVAQLMGGGPRLITDGELPPTFDGLEGFQYSHSMYRHPRSAVGISEDESRIWFVVIDGRQTASRGATMMETARIMKDLGAWNAVNLDGGGSSTLIVNDEWVHRPTDSDWMRTVASALIAISEPYDGEEFGYIRISPEEKVVEVGENFHFNIAGFDRWNDPYEISMDDVTWEILGLDAELGRGGFLALDISEGYIVAHYEHEDTGTVTDTAQVSIVDEVSVDDEPNLPERYQLAQNYPNPFNPDTRIRFDLPEQAHVRLTVYDILGRPIRVLVSEERQPGTYNITFDATGLASGTYIYELSAGDYIRRKKMMLIK